MPFNERFWREDSIHDESFTWDANSRAKESVPKGIQGFIVALPITWTAGESNVSGMNNFLMANNVPVPGGKHLEPGSIADERIVVARTVAPETTT